MNSFNMFLGSQWASMAINGALISLVLVGISWSLLRLVALVKPTNAATNYSVWLASLVMILVAHVALWNPAEQVQEGRAISGEMANKPPATSQAILEKPIAISGFEDLGSSSRTYTGVASQEHASVVLGQDANRMADASPSANSSTPDPKASKRSAELSGAVASTTSIQLSEIASYVLVMFMLIAIGIGILRLVRLVYHILRLRTYRTSGVDITQLCLDRETQQSFRRTIFVIESEHVTSPAAAGLFKAVILFPKGLRSQLSTDAVHQVILHEAAHLERFDDWSILLQRFVESLFFFNPVVWFVGSQMDSNREMACDDWVVSRTGEPEAYVTSISSLLDVHLKTSINPLSAGLSSGKSSLYDRMKRVLEQKGTETTAVSKQKVAMMAGLSALALAAILAGAPLVKFVFSFSSDRLANTQVPQSTVVIETVGEVATMGQVASVGDIATERNAETVGDAPWDEASPTQAIATAIQSQLAEGVTNLERSPEFTQSIFPVVPAGAVSPASLQPPAAVSAVPVSHLSLKSWVALLEATSMISSSSERARILRFAIDKMPHSRPAISAFLEAMASLSTSERSGILRSLMEEVELDTASEEQVIEAILDISSSSEQARLVEAMIRVVPSSSPNVNKIKKVIEGIASSSLRSRLMRSFNNQFN